MDNILCCKTVLQCSFLGRDPINGIPTDLYLVILRGIKEYMFWAKDAPCQFNEMLGSLDPLNIFFSDIYLRHRLVVE